MKGLFHFIAYSKLSEEIMAGTWSLEPKQRPSRSTVYWLVVYGLLSLLTYTSQDCLPRDRNTYG